MTFGGSALGSISSLVEGAWTQAGTRFSPGTLSLTTSQTSAATTAITIPLKIPLHGEPGCWTSISNLLRRPPTTTSDILQRFASSLILPYPTPLVDRHL